MRIRPKGEAMITKIPRITCKVISYNNELLLSVRICPTGEANADSKPLFKASPLGEGDRRKAVEGFMLRTFGTV